MAIRAGDTVFTSNGSPRIVQKRDDFSGQMKLENKPNLGTTDLRHGIINGLSQDTRKEYNQILDEIKSDGDPKVRILALQKKIDELETKSADRQLIKYLKSELIFMMNASGYQPQEFTVSDLEVR